MHQSSRPATVSIVSHRQWRLVEPLLRQLNQHCAGSVDKIVLTLNLPEPIELDPDWPIPVQRIHNRAPRGYGSNHNAAFLHCKTPWFAVLNPDIRLDHDAVAELLTNAGETCGLLAPRIQEPGKRGIEPYRELPTPAELLRRRLPGHRPPASPAWIAGMFMLLRADAFATVRGFDERYFMYCEDVDLCLRLQLAGWTLKSRGDVTVHHEAQRASQASLRPLLWHLVSLGKLWTSGSFWRYAALQRQKQGSASAR